MKACVEKYEIFHIIFLKIGIIFLKIGIKLNFNSENIEAKI